MAKHTDIRKCTILSSYEGRDTTTGSPTFEAHGHVDMEEVHACQWCKKWKTSPSIHLRHLTLVTEEEFAAGRKGYLETEIDKVATEGRELRAELASLDPIPHG